jgi:hypothetical protein
MGWLPDPGFPGRMDLDEEPAADWRDAEAYAPLLDADRSILAWEWLRRDPCYRRAAKAALANLNSKDGDLGPESWGLHVFEAPDLAVPRARPVWHVGIHPYVLQAIAGRAAAPSDEIDLGRFAATTMLVTDASGREHLLFSDGLRAIRLDVLAGSLARGSAELRYLLVGFASAERPLLTLQRLLALRRTGEFSRSLHPREVRARRWVLALRAFDALAAGASQREIAASLVNGAATEPRWRTQAPSLRLQAQRLVRSARLMAAGGYCELLR